MQDCVAQADARADTVASDADISGDIADSGALGDALHASSCSELDVAETSLLALSFSFALATPLQFSATTSINLSAAPATIQISLQPLCAQVSQCVPGEHVGTPLQLAPAPLSEDCAFVANINSGIIPGSANPISGADLAPDIALRGRIESSELYCGTSAGTISSGASLPASGVFGAIPIATGTMSVDLPEPRPQCAPNT